MASEMVWIINVGDEDFERTDVSLKKHVVIKPGRPYQIPRELAMKYLSFNSIRICDNPEKYFNNAPANRLIIRDAGIGDLLLLEPVIRGLKNVGNAVTVVTRFPEVFDHSPCVERVIPMQTKSVLPVGVDVLSYDTYDDLQSYSEICENRDTKHRTDCYNQIFKIDLVDKEPQIWFDKKELNDHYLDKKPGYTYVGLALDGSHYYRRYSKGVQLIRHLLEKDDKLIVVVIGDGWEDGGGFVKIKDEKRIINLQGKTTVRQAFNLIRDLDFMIAVDTGLMHVALSLHIPTVCIFSIITPELRVKYYTGQKQILAKDLDCIGCGNLHMARCKFNTDKLLKPDYIPKCLDIEPEEIYNKLALLEKCEPHYFVAEDNVKKEVNINVLGNRKLTMPIIVLNEEKNLPRFIELVMKHPCIGRVIAIDGGSTDNTVAILRKAGALVYIHAYDKAYHDMQAMQRNYSFSFVKDGEKCLVMDIDECYSKELSEYLPLLCESDIVYGQISRRTFKYYDDIYYPTKQIKDYPDYQPRFFTWNRKFVWRGSPHHQVYNVPGPEKIRKDIIHFECENKDRDELENKWAKMQKKTREIYE